jgi:hypothetical protein
MAACLLAATHLGAQEAELVALESAAIVPLTSESRLQVEGLEGDFSVRLGKDGELRFSSVDRSDRSELPLELWLHRNTLTLRAPADTAETPRIVQVSVPANVAVTVALDGGAVNASGLRDSLDISGSELTVDVRGIGGAVELDLEGGSLFASTIDGELVVNGREVETELKFIGGDVDLDLADSRARLENMRGALELDVEGGSVTLKDSMGPPIKVAARESRLDFRAVANGGELNLEETPLTLRECKGDLMIETDAEVQFNETEADLHVNNWGGSVRGSGNEGLLEIKTEGSQVMVENIKGPLRIQGDRLEVSAKEIAGELLIYATSSNVTVAGAAAGVTVENEFGDVIVSGSSRTAQVTSRDGSVRVLDHTGVVEVDAEGPEVEVSWSSVGRDKDSRIENAAGDVTVRFPRNGVCRLEARSRFGRIETDLPDVSVSDEGNHASGLLGRGSRPTVHVLSEGDVVLTSVAAPAEE